MGYDATNYLPSDVSKGKLVEFLKLLGYIGSGNHFHFFIDDDYKYLYGVHATIAKEKDGFRIYTRTPIYCSPDDLRFQNYTMKQLRNRFGGFFHSDYGRNRYFAEDTLQTVPSERGCYWAHLRLEDKIKGLVFLVNNYKQDELQAYLIKDFGHPSPAALLSNISTTYIVALIENYFKELYIALLKYSDKKERIIKSSKINDFDLYEVSERRISMEEAVALSKSFQNINRIHYHFKELDSRIDIYGTLSKPYRNRKETLFNTVNRVLEHRHSLVHRLYVNIEYSQKDVLKDISSIQTALDRVYKHLCDVNGWLLLI